MKKRNRLRYLWLVVMMRIGHGNSKKDALTIAVKALADTAKHKQQVQIEKLAKKVEELEKAGAK